jgi:hypothetical protein
VHLIGRQQSGAAPNQEHSRDTLSCWLHSGAAQVVLRCSCARLCVSVRRLCSIDSPLS